MRPPKSPAGARGLAFVELLFALILIVVCSALLIGHLAVRYQRDTAERNRVFAFMAAKSILAEVYAWTIDGNDVNALDDGNVVKSNLTLAPSETGSRANGNFQRGGKWIWWRQIRVHAVPGADNRDLRVVTVTILKRAADGTRNEIASMSSVVSMPTVGYPTTQVFDLYLLAIENIPGRGVQMESIRPFVESVIADLERKNPGLEIRTHWITKASYGRDGSYTPDVSTTGAGGVYHYPPKTALGDAVSYYYVPGAIKGRVQEAGAVRNGKNPNTNPLPYALADAFNHGLRLPQERAFHEARVRLVKERKRAIAAARARGAPVPSDLTDMSEEPTLRLLLEDLNTTPDRYRHALILNMHGDVLPMPAMRNYSDAATEPIGLPNLRCVTHPEELRTRRDPANAEHDPVVLRVYAWSEAPDRLPEGGVCPEDHAITLRVMGVDLTDPAREGVLHPDVRLDNLYGGVPVRPRGANHVDRDYRKFTRAKDIHQPRGANEMFYYAQFVDPGFGEEKYSLIWLFRTPVTCPTVRNTGSWLRSKWNEAPAAASGAADRAPITSLPAIRPASSLSRDKDLNKGRVQGLGSDRGSRLYNVEYVPSPTGIAGDFSRDLASPGSGPKNTARWRLSIFGGVFGKSRFVNREGRYHDPRRDVRLTIETAFRKLGAAEPGDEKSRGRTSTTYSWWATDRDAVPMTERAQFLGDPRYCPYKDFVTGDADFGDGYNWFFESLRSGGEDGTAGFPGLDSGKLANGWLGGHRFDAPRYLSVLRQGLLRSRAVFGMLGGNGDTRILLGGETHEGGVDLVRESEVADYWWCRPWLGELRPDSAHAKRFDQGATADHITGNLRAGDSRGAYAKGDAATVYGGSTRTTLGVALAKDPDRAAWSWQAFFNAEVAGRALGMEPARAQGALTEAGRALASHYRTTSADPLSIVRKLAWSPAGLTPEWSHDPYRADRCRAQVVQSFCDVDGGQGSALVQLVRSRDHAVIAVDGSAGIDLPRRARRSLVSVLHGLLTSDEGLPPRVQLLAPTETDTFLDPSTIRLKWELSPARWDNREIADAGRELDESEFFYVFTYTRDGAPSDRQPSSAESTTVESTTVESIRDRDPNAKPGNDEPGDDGATAGESPRAATADLAPLSVPSSRGRTWRYLQDHSIAQPGESPPSRVCRRDAGPGAEEFVFSTPPEMFPAGRYLLRVDVFSVNHRLHGAYHVRKVQVAR